MVRLSLIRKVHAAFDDADGGGGGGGESNGLGVGVGVRAASLRRGSSSSRQSRRVLRVLDLEVKHHADLMAYARQRRPLCDASALPAFMISPHSTSKLCWDTLILLLVLYSAVVVPFSIAFDAQPAGALAVFEVFITSAFLADIALSFVTTYETAGVPEPSLSVVAQHYVCSWLALDLLASFPLAWAINGGPLARDGAAASSSTSQLLQLLRLFKLFRLLRLIKLFPRLFAVFEASVRIDPAILRFLRSFVFLAAMWHYLACVYWFVVRSEYGGIAACPAGSPMAGATCFVNRCLCDFDPLVAAAGGGLGAVTQLGATDPDFAAAYWNNGWLPSATIATAPLSVQYVAAVGFAMVTTTSIGNLNAPTNTLEGAFTAAVVFVGLMMYAIVIGSAGDALANIDAAGAARRATADAAMTFLRSARVPHFFQRIVLDYLAFAATAQLRRQPPEALEEALPAHLRQNLDVIIRRDCIHSFRALASIPPDVVLGTVARLAPAIFLPGEFIARAGEPGDTLFFLRTGKVDAVLHDGVTAFETVLAGGFFGERALLTRGPREASFRAVGFVDVLVMDRATLVRARCARPKAHDPP